MLIGAERFELFMNGMGELAYKTLFNIVNCRKITIVVNSTSKSEADRQIDVARKIVKVKRANKPDSHN